MPDTPGDGPPAPSDGSSPRAHDEAEQFRALVEAVDEYAIFRLGTDGTIESWNLGAERIKGYSAEEIVGEHLSTFYTEDARAAGIPEQNLAGAAENGSIEDEGWRVRADGSQFWANVTITAIRDDDGTLEGFAKVTRDMTDQKRTEEERQLHLSVSHALAEAASLEDGLLAVLEEVCEWTDWVAGQAWIRRDDGYIERLPVSYAHQEEYEHFVDASCDYRFGPGEGIPGRAVESASPVWFPDVTTAPESVYPRTTLAAESGLNAGLGVPVLRDGEVAVILEFYMDERRDVDDRLVDLVSSITPDLGNLVARKQAEDELQRDRELLVEMMEAAPVGITVLSAEGEIERMNKRATDRRRGRADSDDVDGGPPTFYDENGDPVPADAHPFARVRDSGEPVYDWMAQIELPDGKRKWLSIDAAPIVTADGELDRVVVVEEDLTELREQYRAITEAINDVIITIDEDSLIRSVNPAVADVFGYTQDELLDESLVELMPDGYDEQHRAAIARYLETGERTLDWNYVELPGRRADGSEIPIAVSFSEIRYQGEQFFTGVIRDISQRKEYERMLEESNERLEQFAYAASHDLQEPLRMISSYLQLLERRYTDELDEDGREFIEFAVDGADRMRDMIEGLLAYSRVDTRGDPFEPIELDDVLAAVRRDLQVKIEETDADVTAVDLPRVYGDPRQVRQVFQNLLDNAIEYSDGPPRVHVDAERDGDQWIVSVSDEGVGIDPGDADRVFEVFQRLHTQEEHSGTGIGLALVERIVERHGGTVWVDSEPGGGATFSFTLPAERTDTE